MTNDLQKQLIQRMGELTEKPKESSLHIHPLLNPERELGGDDLEISTISSRQRKAHHGKAIPRDLGANRQALESWHSDIQSENVPSDYTCLRLVELPTVGGGSIAHPRPKCEEEAALTKLPPHQDTLWASGYEVYDRLSESMKKLLEQHTANYSAPCKISEPKNRTKRKGLTGLLTRSHQSSARLPKTPN